MDDARAYMYPIRPGWRWEEGSLWYRKEWEREDELLSPTERTKRVVQESMIGVTKCLRFTAETCEDFEDGWLPTLDFKLRISANNIIEYTFFEKPTASNRCLQEDTALNQNTLITSLNNEVGRRLDNCSPTVTIKDKVAILDTFCQKMANSGHSVKTIRVVLVGGIRGYKRKLARSLERGEPVHRSSQQSARARRVKKLLARTQCFRDDGTTENESETESATGKYQGGNTTSKVAQESNSSKRRQPREGTSKVEGLKTTTVLFLEFSRGGSLQKNIKERLEKISPMLGFKTRVSEKGGTPLSSLLSNKDPWSGVACGRGSCRTCSQPEERKEPCMRRNIVYESECTSCNPPGSRKEADKDGLAERKGFPSLYVGESSRSVAERAEEHWKDAENGKEESHMLEHQVASHRGEGTPEFNFRVVKTCKTSLERQVREAVRIHMRGEVLNKKGMYNRCKLTRMVVDQEWENQVWKEAWSIDDPVIEEEWLEKAKSSKRRGGVDASSKRIKREEGGVVWGEDTSGVGERLDNFLYEPVTSLGMRMKQSTLKPVTGLEWFCRQILREVTGRVVELSQDLEGVAEWEEWEPEHSVRARSSKEERKLWYILEELDKADYKAEKLKMKKEKAKVAKARAKMGVGRKQPSILESFGAKSSKYKPSGVGGGSVNTLTGSVSVAASQSNIVTPWAGQECPGDSLWSGANLGSSDVSLVDTGTSVGSTHVSLEENNEVSQDDASLVRSEASIEGPDAHAHPISHPEEYSHAIARIGLVADEVGPKKLKTSEYHQPGPATEYLLGVVRGVGGTKEGAVTGGVIRQTEMSSQQTKTVIEVHTVRDGRPGWKSSQADITDGVSRAVPSPLETKPSKELTSNQQTKTVLDVHSVGGGRSGWKSSQADITDRVSGAVPSPLETQPSKQLTNLLPSNPEKCH